MGDLETSTDDLFQTDRSPEGADRATLPSRKITEAMERPRVVEGKMDGT
jgi:hypothetical protein